VFEGIWGYVALEMELCMTGVLQDYVLNEELLDFAESVAFRG
jgi:hypothetical protein